MLPRHHFGFSRTSRSVMQTWWSCGNQTQSPANHFYRSRVLHVIVFTSLYVLRLAEAFWESTANTVQQMCLWLLPLWVILLNQQELQLIQQSACRKHSSNDPKCQELGWVCIPLAVETYGNWDKEAQNTFSCLASLLSISQCSPKIHGVGSISL